MMKIASSRRGKPQARHGWSALKDHSRQCHQFSPLGGMDLAVSTIPKLLSWHWNCSEPGLLHLLVVQWGRFGSGHPAMVVVITSTPASQLIFRQKRQPQAHHECSTFKDNFHRSVRGQQKVSLWCKSRHTFETIRLDFFWCRGDNFGSNSYG